MLRHTSPMATPNQSVEKRMRSVAATAVDGMDKDDYPYFVYVTSSKVAGFQKIA